MLSFPLAPEVNDDSLGSVELTIPTDDTEVAILAVASDSGITETVRINTLVEFTEKFGPFKATDALHVAVRSYFENGGASCYLIPTTRLIAEVPGRNASLLVAAGQGILEAVSKLCVPDACLFAVLDGPQGKLSEENTAQYPLTSHAAVYYPWLSADWAETAIPPSAAMAGLYCRLRRERGVWASQFTTPLRGGVRPSDLVTDEQKAQYGSINIIQEITGRGVISMSAKTLDQASRDFRYIPDRRLVDHVQQDIRSGLRGTLFKPNGPQTWADTRAAIDEYLFRFWRLGALGGGGQQESYFIEVGVGLTMTKDDIQSDLMRVRVGIAVVRPAEFVILNSSQKLSGD